MNFTVRFWLVKREKFYAQEYGKSEECICTYSECSVIFTNNSRRNCVYLNSLTLKCTGPC